MKNKVNPKFNIRKGDTVAVIAGSGKDRTKPRRVLSVIREENRLLVEGVHIVTKHKKPNAQNPQGSIVKEEAPIHISNVMLWDSKKSVPTRITRERKESSFVRISKKSGEEIK